MVKTTTPRNVRSMRRNMLKLREESAQNKRDATKFSRIVLTTREMYQKRFHCLQTENLTLLQSLKNLNKTCTQQKELISGQNRMKVKLQKAPAQLHRLKNALQSIRTRKRTNIALYRASQSPKKQQATALAALKALTVSGSPASYNN